VERSELERELERLHAESWGWALACVGQDHELAREVLQTVYVKMLAGTAAPGARSSFRTWAFGVIRMTALEQLRARRRIASRFDDSDALTDRADPAPGPDVVTEHAERAAALTAALATLSARQREVLQLVFYHGMTIEEAARVMHLSLGSARTHYERGKKALAFEIAHMREDVS
jgi:RNA polymerase sigma factor (sigma-70 family)